MAGRYTEARLYLAGTSIALLLMAWAALAVQDRQGSEAAAAPTAGQVTISGNRNSLTQPVAPSARPHTRTRGS